MKKLVIVPFLLIFIANSHSQSLAIGGGAIGFLPKYTTFDYFVDSYNRYHQNNLKTQLTSFPFMVGPYFNFSYLPLEGLTLDAGYQSFHHSIHAEFINGDKRYFDMTCRYMDFIMGMGPAKGNKGIWLIGGMQLGSVNIGSYYQYADGSYSYGLEKRLNGQYRGLYMGALYGIKVTYPIGKIASVWIQADRIVVSHRYLTDALEDGDAGKVYTQMGTQNICTDYYHTASLLANHPGIQDQYSVRVDAGGYNFTAGLLFTIN
jgi:hypothetical protein